MTWRVLASGVLGRAYLPGRDLVVLDELGVHRLVTMTRRAAGVRIRTATSDPLRPLSGVKLTGFLAAATGDEDSACSADAWSFGLPAAGPMYEVLAVCASLADGSGTAAFCFEAEFAAWSLGARRYPRPTQER
jgi:hypothetical protein